MHNVPGGINVHGLMACLMEHFQLGAGYSVVSVYSGDASGDIAFFFFFFFVLGYRGGVHVGALLSEDGHLFFFFFFFFGRDGYSLHKCNDSNLKTM